MPSNYGSEGKPVNMGSIHIKLPFNSMDDVSFSGNFAPLADKLVETLQDHLDKNPSQAPDLGLEHKATAEPEMPDDEESIPKDTSRTMNPEDAYAELKSRQNLQQNPLEGLQGLQGPLSNVNNEEDR